MDVKNPLEVERAADVRRLLVRGGLWATFFQVASKVSVLVSTVALARVLSVNDFGLFVAAQGVTFVVVSATDLGSSMLLERELAAGRATRGLSARVYALRLRFVVPVVVATSVCYGVATGPASLALVAPMALAAVAMSYSMVSNAALQGALEFRSSAMSQTAGRLVYTGTIALLLFAPGSTASLPLAASCFALGELTIVLGQIAPMRRAVVLPQGAVNGHYGVRSYLPYWLNSVVNLVYNRADVTLVSILAGVTQAGLYAPASSIQNAGAMLPGIVTAALPAVGARIYASANGEAQLVRIVARSAALAGAAGFLAWVLIAVVIAPRVGFVLGVEFRGIGMSVAVLALSLPFYGVELALISYLFAIGRPGLTVWGFVAALITATLGQLLLTPTHGAAGAAVANACREPVAVLAFLSAVLYARRHPDTDPRDRESNHR